MTPVNNLYPDHLLLYPKKYAPKHTLTVNWEISDTEQAFEKNCKKQPEDWYYRTHPVTYRYNTNKYRCPEWADVNWQDTWAVFGCSCVEGVGLDESDTLTARISEILGDPVVNLGVSGSGPDATLFNSLRLIDQGIRPKGVILINSDFSLPRLTLFTPDTAMPMGHWVFTWAESDPDRIYPNLYKLWTINSGNAEAHSYMSLRGAVGVWKAESIPTFHFNITQDLPTRIDVARDLVHPGRESVKLWATEITNQIRSQP
jgi:hypothetical protein